MEKNVGCRAFQIGVSGLGLGTVDVHLGQPEGMAAKSDSAIAATGPLLPPGEECVGVSGVVFG
jgi:hypothetical protein